MSVQKSLLFRNPSFGETPPAVALRHAPDATYPFQMLSDVTCFLAGTSVRAPQGDVPIETLDIGDLVVTRDRGAQPIRWIGQTTVDTDPDTAPIAIDAGAFDNASPLLVSPEHRLLLTGWRCAMVAGTQEVFAAAKDLVNGRDITRATPAQVTYIHIAFDQHEIMTTDNIHSESFHPDATPLGMLAGQTRSALVTAFPKISAAPKGYGPPARAQVKAYEARLIRP